MKVGLRCRGALSPPKNLRKEYRAVFKFFGAATECSLRAVELHGRERSEAALNAVKRAEHF